MQVLGFRPKEWLLIWLVLGIILVLRAIWRDSRR
jgi:hypothetical protein